MTIIIASHAAHLSGRERLTRKQGLSLPSRLRLALSFTPTRGRLLYARENVTDRIRVGSRAGARRQPEKLTTGLLNPARTEFFGAIYRPLRSPSGSTRVHDANQPAHVCCPFTHVTLSSYAVGSHVHLTTGASACPNQGGANPHRNGANP